MFLQNIVYIYTENSSVENFECNNTIEAYGCKKCPTFQTNCVSYLKHHLEKAHSFEIPDERIYNCKKCDFETYSKYVIARHRLFTCTKDLKARAKSPQKHRTNIVTRPVAQNNPDSNCSKDEQYFFKCFSISNTSGKATSKIEWFHCGQCKAKCRFEKNLKKHIFESHTEFQCEKCPMKFKGKKLLAKHVRTKHGFNCHLCIFIGKTTSNVERHIFMKHVHPDKKGLVRCVQCEKRFEDKMVLRTHLRVEHSQFQEMLYECEACPFISGTKAEVKVHLRRGHLREEWYECDICSVTYKRKSYLQKHMKTKHKKKGAKKT